MLGCVEGFNLEVVAATVSKNRVSIEERCGNFLSPKKAARTAKNTGFKKLSIVDEGVCTSDLCYYTVKKLFDKGISRSEDIGAIIFISQSPDYLAPSTAYILQERLDLPKDIIAFDVNLGCSGFVYGIYLAVSLLSNIHRKVLICCGDASLLSDKLDMPMLPLAGDAGAVAIIGKSFNSKIFFNIDSYGERYNHLIIPRGGSRANKITNENGDLIAINDNYFNMDGMEIMYFSTRDVPINIDNLLKFANMKKDELEIAFFHQANKVIVESLADKLEIPQSKVPFESGDVGNANSASIPICMTELKKHNTYTPYRNVLMSGFGVGLSVASLIIDLSDTLVLGTFEYE